MEINGILPPITILLILSTSDPVIKPRYEKPQNGKKLDSCSTKACEHEASKFMLTRACK